MMTNKINSSEMAGASAQNAVLYGVLDSIPDIIFFKNLNGEYLGCNEAFTRLMGKNRSEIIGRTAYELYDRNQARAFCMNDQLVMKGGGSRRDEQWVDFPGMRRMLLDTLKSPLRDNEGRITGIVGISRDITDRKNVEDELRRTNVYLEETTAKARELARQAESADIAKRQFLANMSHEIRTPLNGVIAMNRLMLETMLTDRQRRYAELAKSSGESLLAIVNDILDFSKIEAGKLEIECIRFAIDDVICGALDVFSDIAAEKNIQIHAAIDPAVPAWIKGDPLRLSQILNNLVGNAIKYSDDGNILVSVNLRYRDRHTVVISISVKDSGIGIAQEQLATIFLAFGQADKSTTRKFGGTGLGLTICKQLCEMMGGRIRVESTPGKGSVFSFVLPFELAENTSDPLLAEPAWNGKKVLVADDNPTTRHILSKLLSGSSNLVRCVSSGPDALNLLREADINRTPFDLCLLDYRMTPVNGIETAHLIRRENLTSPPALMLMVTSRDRIETREPAISANILGCITKPIRPSKLLDEIRAALDITACGSVKKSCFQNVRYSNIRALTVEDHEINQEVIIELFKNIGIETDIACNGREAVEKVRSRDYDVVFMDIHMPVMDGFDATRAIRNLNKAGVDKLPILAMTALVMKEDRERIIQSGMNGHITKPIDIDELIRVLENWLPKEKQPDVSAVAVKTADDPEPGLTASTLRIPGLDETAGLHRLNGNQDLYLSLLSKFARDDTYAVTREQVLGDPETAHRTVHSIRSIAGNLGAAALASAAAELEKSLKAGRGYEEHLSIFLEQNNALRTAIAAVVPRRQDDAQAELLKPMGSTDNLRQLLIQLRSPVTGNEPRACQEILKLLPAKRWPDETMDGIVELSRLISKYRFDEAANTLDRLLDSID